MSKTMGEDDAWVALLVLSKRGRVIKDDTPRIVVAECDALTIMTRQTRKKQYPMLLTVDAPERVLECEFASETECSVLVYAPDPRWMARLLNVAKPDEQDALYARALAGIVIGAYGRVQLPDMPYHYFVAEHSGMTITLHPNRPAARPMLLTIDASDRVLELEFASFDDDHVVIVKHVPGPWQRGLFKAAKPKLKWRDRTRWAAPWRRGRDWPFNHAS